MKFYSNFEFGLALLLGLMMACSPALARTTAKQHTSSKTSTTKISKPSVKSHAKSSARSTRKKHRSSRTSSWKLHGQQGIDADRAREIQTALIREKYLNGEASGLWDQRTKAAMTRYQADHGWQTKVLPDSRALIQLGLGPRHDNLLNPESVAAMPAIAIPLTRVSASNSQSNLSSSAPQR